MRFVEQNAVIGESAIAGSVKVSGHPLHHDVEFSLNQDRKSVSGTGGGLKSLPHHDRWLIQNVGQGFLGNFPYFWRREGSGYTVDVNEAGVFTKRAAMRIVDSCRGSHDLRILSHAIVMEFSIRVCDAQWLRKDQRNEIEGNP